MKKRFFLFLLLFSKNVLANVYKEDIDNLQKQIDDLRFKINYQKSKNNNEKITLFDEIKISGRLHIDSSWFRESAQLKKYQNSSYNDELDIRRARLGISKKINNFKIKIDTNFEKDRTYLSQAYIEYKISNNKNIKVGQLIPPSFMEKEKSSNTMATIDFNSFSRIGWLDSYLIGVDYSLYGNNSGLSFGIFKKGLSNSNTTDNLANYNLLLRNYYTPLKNSDFILHIGYNLSYQSYENNFVKNIQHIKNRFYYGLELALQYRFININNEFIKLYYDYDNSRFNGNNFNFDGFSSEIVVDFTGEIRKYNKNGYFGGINVINPISKSGIGAFQGVFAYSYANGKDKSNGYLNNIGSSYNYTVGLNWIPEDYFIILFDYSFNKIVKKNYSLQGKYRSFKIEARIFF